MNTDTIPLPVSPAFRSSDEVRAKMVQKFEAIKPTLALYREYGAQASALSEEFHKLRFKETFPGVNLEEYTLAAQLDVRETPATLDSKLGHLKDADVRRIIFDRATGTFFIYV